jgi:hypothetical protein
MAGGPGSAKSDQYGHDGQTVSKNFAHARDGL